jgi:hypothetical protein
MGTGRGSAAGRAALPFLQPLQRNKFGSGHSATTPIVWRSQRIFQDNIRYTSCDHCSAISVAVVAARENMPGTPDWEDGMLAYLPIMTIALLAMTAISVATVALAMVADYYIDIDSFNFGPG